MYCVFEMDKAPRDEFTRELIQPADAPPLPRNREAPRAA